MTRPLIYLATAYSYDPDEGYRLACDATAKLLARGHVVFSPIVHCHEITALSDLARWTQAEWYALDYIYLCRCEELWVLEDDGGHWRLSEGVRRELGIARQRRMPIRFLTADLTELEPLRENVPE